MFMMVDILGTFEVVIRATSVTLGVLSGLQKNPSLKGVTVRDTENNTLTSDSRGTSSRSGPRVLPDAPDQSVRTP